MQDEITATPAETTVTAAAAAPAKDDGDVEMA